MSDDRDHEKRLDLKNISKIELTVFANESDVEYERKVKNDTIFFLAQATGIHLLACETVG